jgi:hypothetical protein
MGLIGSTSTNTNGCTRRSAISAQWSSRKIGSPVNNGWQHNERANEDVLRGQGHLGGTGTNVGSYAHKRSSLNWSVALEMRIQPGSYQVAQSATWYHRAFFGFSKNSEKKMGLS